jgi:hypothetical protein
MTSIVIYAAEPANPSATSAQSERIDGMIAAGAELKLAFANAAIAGGGVLSDGQIEAEVCKVVDYFATPGNGFEPVLEHRPGTVTPSFYSIAKRPNPMISKFDLTNKTVPSDTRKLDLVGKADSFASMGNNYKMTTVAPLKAGNTTAWEYLYDTVYNDLKAINTPVDQKDETINYLIATFAFTRCR